MFNEPLPGYSCALVVFGSLFQFKGVVDYLLTIFANLSNVLTLIVFILQFKRPLNKLIIFQLIAFISAIYWAILDLIQGNNLSNLFIGYWNWVFGIFFMLIVMLAFHRHTKKALGYSQHIASPDASTPRRRA